MTDDTPTTFEVMIEATRALVTRTSDLPYVTVSSFTAKLTDLIERSKDITRHQAASNRCSAEMPAAQQAAYLQFLEVWDTFSRALDGVRFEGSLRLTDTAGRVYALCEAMQESCDALEESLDALEPDVAVPMDM